MNDTLVPSSTPARTLTRRVLTSVVSNAFAPIAGFAVTPVLAHALGVDGRGAVAAATAPLFLAMSVATIGVPGAVTWSIAKNPAALRRVLGPGMLLVTGAGLLATALLTVCSGWLGAGSGSLAGLVTMASLALVPNLLAGVLCAAAAGLHAWSAVARERALTNGLRLAGIAILAALGELTPTSAVIVIASAPVIGALSYLPLVIRRRAVDIPTEDHVGAGALVSYGLRMWAGSLSGVVLSRLDQTVMAPLGGVDELGLYAVAVSVAGLVAIVNLAVREVMFSADAANDDIESLARSARLSTAATAAGAVVVGATASWTVPLLFGAEFTTAVPATLLLLAAAVLGNSGSVAGISLAARGRPGLRSASLAVASVVNVAAVILLVPHLGAVGAAAATLIGNTISGWGCVYLLHRITGVPARSFVGLRLREDLTAITTLIRSRKGTTR